MGSALSAPQILLVEDEWIAREDIAEIFRRAGWLVIEANSAEEALSFFEKGYAIDAVVTDIRLAGNMDGFELGEVMRAVGHNPPVIYVSAWPPTDRPMTADSAFHAKPVSPGELLATTERLLHRPQST